MFRSGCGIRIFGDVWHPLPRGGGGSKKFPNAPKLDTTHPYLLTAALLTEEKIIHMIFFVWLTAQVDADGLVWQKSLDQKGQKAPMPRTPPHSAAWHHVPNSEQGWQ